MVWLWQIFRPKAVCHPALYGRFALERLTLSGKQAPVELFLESKLESLLSGYQATLAGHWQTPQGPLALTGQANWLVMSNWFAELKLKGNNLQLNLPDTQLTFSPDLHFSAGPERGNLSGSVTVPAGKIKVNDLPENAIRVSDDEIVLASLSDNPSPLQHWQLSTDVRLLFRGRCQAGCFWAQYPLTGPATFTPARRLTGSAWSGQSDQRDFPRLWPGSADQNR